jgi:hypothetical protein
MNKGIKLIVLSLLTIVFISGCSISFDNKSNEAKEYLKEKYGINKKVNSWKCVSYDDTLNNCSKNSIYYFEDNIEVYYDANRKEFQDNYQNEEILSVAENFFMSKINTIGDVRLTKNDVTNKVTFNTNIKGNSYFHEKYEGNIEEYALKGGLIPKLSAGYVITSRGDYRRLLNNTKTITDTYFKTNYISLFYISPNLYNQTIFPDTNNEECYAKYINGTITEQNFIVLVGGLTISSNVPSINLSGDDVTVLNENDIIGTQTETGEDINTYDNYVPVFNELLQDTANRNGTTYKEAKPIGSALYKIKFTNELKDKVMASNTDKLDIYMKINTSNKVFYYDSSYSKEGHGIQLNEHGEKEVYTKIQDGDYIWFE